MKEHLSNVRQTTIQDLCRRYSVCKNTVRTDLDHLETEMDVPLERKSGNGGYIRVIDGWYASRNYLYAEEEQTLRDILPGLQPEQQIQVLSILKRFAKPRVNHN